MFDALPAWAEGGLWGYVVVAIAAATPWVEVLLVIPAAVALGLDPFGVGVVAFAGNFAPVVGIVACYERLARRPKPGRAPPPPSTSRRRARARKLLTRYGVPGLALLGPLLTGIHLAVLLALAARAPRRHIVVWAGASLAAWTVGLTIASSLGVEFVLR